MHILNLIRIKDWLKNIILILPLIFSGYLFEKSLYFNLLFGFFTFSIASSTIYILNDIMDLDKDKIHNTKKFTKPIVFGRFDLPCCSGAGQIASDWLRLHHIVPSCSRRHQIVPDRLLLRRRIA